MREFRETGRFAVAPEAFRRARADFAAERCDDDETKTIIRAVHDERGRLVDPHTAIGIAAARRRRAEIKGPIVAVGTAHPAKFPDAVAAATGIVPALPPRLANLFERAERYRVLPNDTGALKRTIVEVLTNRGSM